MKESFYFQHDYNAFLDPKIRYVVYEHSIISYAVFWIAIEILASQKDFRAKWDGFAKGILPLIQGKSMNYSGDDGIGQYEDDDGNIIGLGEEACFSICLARLTAMLECMVEQGLFTVENGLIYSKSLDERMRKRKEISEKRKKSGRLGGLSKAISKRSVALAKQKIANAYQERKGKEKKKDINNPPPPSPPTESGDSDISDREKLAKKKTWEVEDYLLSEYTRLSGRQVRVVAQPRRKIASLLKIFSVEDIRRAWAQMAVNTFLRGGDGGGKDYFTIEYATRPNKAEEYLQDFARSNPHYASKG